jgi:hypothetical protein
LVARVESGRIRGLQRSIVGVARHGLRAEVTLTTLVLTIVFLIMVAAPCAIAVRNSRKYAPEAEEAETPAEEAIAGVSLDEMLIEAEAYMVIARERAREAHWTALAAEAKVAALRADAAAEIAALAGRAAEKAIRAAEEEIDYLPQSHPSLDFPRSRVRRRAA